MVKSNIRPVLPGVCAWLILLTGCLGAEEAQDDAAVYGETEQSVIGECSTTAQCKELYPGATDCRNGEGGICYCGERVCGAATGGSPGGSGQTGWRVGYSADGNQHDWDDLHATPMTLALLHRAGLKGKLVHFDYNNHLGDSNSSMAEQQRGAVSWAIQQLGYDSSLFFDDQQNLNGAIASIAAAVNASSPTNRFILICAGPMEVCWRGINAASDSKEQYVTVVSHSTWNDGHQDTAQLNHTWNSIKNDFDVLAHHINDQNPPAFNSGCSSWTWLRGIPGYGNGLYDRVCVTPRAKAGDASDAGMMYYVIRRGGQISGNSGVSNPTMSDVRSYFGR